MENRQGAGRIRRSQRQNPSITETEQVGDKLGPYRGIIRENAGETSTEDIKDNLAQSEWTERRVYVPCWLVIRGEESLTDELRVAGRQVRRRRGRWKNTGS